MAGRAAAGVAAASDPFGEQYDDLMTAQLSNDSTASSPFWIPVSNVPDSLPAE